MNEKREKNSIIRIKNRVVKKFLIFLILTFTGITVGVPQKRFRLMEWNVENMFDTLHCEGKEDGTFTPKGDQRWTSQRYWGKQSRIARTIATAGGETPCDLVALVEVENDSVLTDLVLRTKLWKLGYKYILCSTNDKRGISVGLLYQPPRFRPFCIDTLSFNQTDSYSSPTRNALHVAGETVTSDTLDVFVLHLPSRRNGHTAKRFREYILQHIHTYADSLLSIRQNPYLIITGDFNSWYPEKCISEKLGASLPTDFISTRSFYILSNHLKASHEITGTYKYQGEWNRLDHFIVNGNFLIRNKKTSTLYTSESACRIVDFPFLLQEGKGKSEVRPFRTYWGTYYQGGYSDHLPLLLDLYY